VSVPTVEKVQVTVVVPVQDGAAWAGVTPADSRPTDATPAPRATADPITGRRRTRKRPSLDIFSPLVASTSTDYCTEGAARQRALGAVSGGLLAALVGLTFERVDSRTRESRRRPPSRRNPRARRQESPTRAAPPTVVVAWWLTASGQRPTAKHHHERRGFGPAVFSGLDGLEGRARYCRCRDRPAGRDLPVKC
jgi:hypothetical protein